MIQLSNIHFRYSRKKLVFENLGFSIGEGHIYGLLGKNGAGKSTLLKLLSGLLFPQRGSIVVDGFIPSQRTPGFLKQMFMVPEEFTLPAISTQAFARHTGCFYPGFSQEDLKRYMLEFEIPHASNLQSLSLGQRKKFFLAFAFSTNTKTILLDEPTNGLDIPSKSQFRKILASLMTEEKKIIISTHQVRDLESLIDSIIILDRGKIIFNRDIYEISEKLSFEEDLRHTPADEVVYAQENGIRGGIKVNKQSGDTKVDLEILFNAVIQKGETFDQYFRN